MILIIMIYSLQEYEEQQNIYIYIYSAISYLYEEK